jgi:membrane protein required for beta-lactamase induction
MVTTYLLATLTPTWFGVSILLLALFVSIGVIVSLVADEFRKPLLPARDMARNSDPHPGISMHQIQVGGGVAGLLFTIACFALLGPIPVLRYFLALSIVLGIAMALVRYRLHR